MYGAVALLGNDPDALIGFEVFHARAFFSREHNSFKAAGVHAGAAPGAGFGQDRGFAFKLYGAEWADLNALLARDAFFGISLIMAYTMKPQGTELKLTTSPSPSLVRRGA